MRQQRGSSMCAQARVAPYALSRPWTVRLGKAQQRQVLGHLLLKFRRPRIARLERIFERDLEIVSVRRRVRRRLTVDLAFENETDERARQRLHVEEVAVRNGVGN